MIVDASALMAVVNAEPEAEQFAHLLLSQEATISVANWLEVCLVADRRSSRHSRDLDDVVAMAGVKIAPVTVEHGQIAREAHRRFGKGSGSPARLNFGDCFAYALARSTDEPLLFKGDDFTHTDIRSALG